MSDVTVDSTRLSDSVHLSGRFKPEKTDFVGFIAKNHILRYVNPVFYNLYVLSKSFLVDF